MKSRSVPLIVVAVATIILVVAIVWSDNRSSARSDFGAVASGRELVRQEGCGACHQIPGVPTANGRVGPPLQGFAGRSFIAGKLANNPENLVRWLRNPQAVSPGTAMPDLGLSATQAEAIAAFLQTLD